MTRDRVVGQLLKSKGWRVVRIWEHSLAEPAKVVARVKLALVSGRREA